MTKRMIDRLGAFSYGVLIFGIFNGSIQRSLSREEKESLPVLIPLIVVNLFAVVVLFYCLISFICHLVRENKCLGGIGKAIWFVLLLFGSAVTMPVYWYLYVVRDRIAGEEREVRASEASAVKS